MPKTRRPEAVTPEEAIAAAEAKALDKLRETHSFPTTVATRRLQDRLLDALSDARTLAS